MYALGHPSIPPSAPGFLQQSFSSSTKSKSLETMYHWLVYCSRCWRCRDTQNLHKNCWLVWDCFDLGRHYCAGAGAGAGAAYLRLQVEVHQGEAAAMKVDAKDAKMKQLQEWEKGRRVEVEDEWIRIRPRRQFKQRGGNGCWNGRKGQMSQKTKSREQRATQPMVRMIKKSESKLLREIDKQSESWQWGEWRRKRARMVIRAAAITRQMEDTRWELNWDQKRLIFPKDAILLAYKLLERALWLSHKLLNRSALSGERSLQTLRGFDYSLLLTKWELGRRRNFTFLHFCKFAFLHCAFSNVTKWEAAARLASLVAPPKHQPPAHFVKTC